MMMHAYDRMYLSKVSRTLGNMLHDAVIEYGFDGELFLRQFIQSRIAHEIETGNPKYLAGFSGHEMLLEVTERTTGEKLEPLCIETFERSNAYWVGWILARYQWYSGKSFKEILDTLSFETLLNLYMTLHEEDEHNAYDVFDKWLKTKGSALQRVRRRRHMTQEALAEKSGVSINTIRAYERGSKDIGKAQIDILDKLANVLRCEIKEII